MDKFKFDKLEKAGTYTVLRNDVTIMAVCTAEAHASAITDALNRADNAAEREKWIAVNAMSLMHGLHRPGYDQLVSDMQEASGGVFVAALVELAPLAAKVTEVELAVYAASEEGLPGVFQYEVTEEVGAALAHKLRHSRNDCLLDFAMQKLGDLAYAFMQTGDTGPEALKKMADVIAGVLPNWSVSTSSSVTGA